MASGSADRKVFSTGCPTIAAMFLRNPTCFGVTDTRRALSEALANDRSEEFDASAAEQAIRDAIEGPRRSGRVDIGNIPGLEVYIST